MFNLRFFFPRRQPPTYMRELYCGYVDLYSKRGRERRLRANRELQRIYCRLYLFILLDNIKGRTGCFSVDIAQIGWTAYICVSLVLCMFFCVYIFAIFYVFHFSIIYNFLTPRLHGIGHNWLDHGNVDQAYSLAKDPTLSVCESWPTPAPRQVAHQGPRSTKFYPSHGGTQRNGDHFFLRVED